MKFTRLIVDVLLFAAGAGVGIYWGVNHPEQAAGVARQERVQTLKVQVAADKARIDVLRKFGKDSTEAQAALADAQKNLDQANQELAEQSPPQPQ